MPSSLHPEAVAVFLRASACVLSIHRRCWARSAEWECETPSFAPSANGEDLSVLDSFSPPKAVPALARSSNASRHRARAQARKDEVDKLLRKGEGWLAAHPHKEAIVKRYLPPSGPLAPGDPA